MASAIMFSAAMIGSTSATHSVPAELMWWDLNNDGLRQASEGDVVYDTAGNDWTSTKEARLSEALAEWRNSTSYDPTVGTSSHYVYVDGRAPSPCASSWPAGATAANCIAFTDRGSYRDIGDSDIFLNENALLFNYSDSFSPAAQGRFDAEGVFTHEAGHGIFLMDLYGASNCPTETTMCGVTDAYDSRYYRDLTSDDIDSANFVY